MEALLQAGIQRNIHEKWDLEKYFDWMMKG